LRGTKFNKQILKRIIMPFSVRMKKSGSKRVHPRPKGNTDPSLDTAARELWRGAGYTSGTAGLKDPLKPRQSDRTAIVIENHKRRKLASLHKISARV
jgi:hypothetical protein